MAATKIEWATESWNPIRYLNGWMCTKISEGCKNCYAESWNRQFGNRLPYHDAPTPRSFRLDEKVLSQPLHWRKPRRVFVQSMGDLYHEEIPFDYITRVFDVMCSWRWPNKAAEREQDDSLLVDPGHTYMVLTKRPQRVQDWLCWMGEFWPGDSPASAALEATGKLLPCVQFGVTVETEDYLWRLNDLIKIPAAVKFVSLEPLLGDMDISRYLWRDRIEDDGLDEYRRLIDWVIVGPETGPNRRLCKPEWIENIIEQCDGAGVPVFVKAFPMPDGRISKVMAKWPAWARRREQS